MSLPNDWMKVAIRVAHEKMMADEGGPFGAVVVKKDELIATGWNRVTSGNDPTAHAEMEAIRNACRELKNFDLSGCEIYCSCEPCPMCYAGIYWSRIEKIFFAASSSDAANAGFDDQEIYRQLGLLRHERDLPMTEMMSDEARDVLKAWTEKSDRTHY